MRSRSRRGARLLRGASPSFYTVLLAGVHGAGCAGAAATAPVDHRAAGARRLGPECPSKARFFSLRADRVRLRGANVYQADRAQRDEGADFGPPLARDDLAALRAAGASWVALSVPGTWHVRRRAPWPESRAHLDRIVRWAAEVGLFVTIGLRTGPGRGEGDLVGAGLRDRAVFTTREDQDAWAAMWTEVATAYRAAPHVVGYQLLVEPHGVSPDAWRAVAQRWVDAVRAVDLATPILAGLPEWGGAAALEGAAPLAGSGIAYSVHAYEPRGYTHAEGATAFASADLDLTFAQVDAFQKRTGSAVVVDEWGAAVAQPGVATYFAAMLERLEARGIDHAVWLWEVSDDAGYRKFDVRRSPAALDRLRAPWSKNDVDARACKKE